MDIESVRASHEQQLMQLPNVNGVGIGKKGGKEVIKVFVTRKIPEDSLKSDEVIPRTIGGFETDVEELGVVSAQGQ
jgi:hypothetical protein